MDHNVWRGTNLTITKGRREEGDSAFFESLDRQCPHRFQPVGFVLFTSEVDCKRFRWTFDLFVILSDS